jgi:hypothetical protein
MYIIMNVGQPRKYATPATGDQRKRFFWQSEHGRQTHIAQMELHCSILEREIRDHLTKDSSGDSQVLRRPYIQSLR